MPTETSTRSSRSNLWAIKPRESAPFRRLAGTPTIAVSLPPGSTCEYWRRRFAGRDLELQLPFCHSAHRIEATTLVTPTVDLGADSAERIHTLARHELTTPFTVILAAWQAVLARHARQPEFVVGCGLPGGLLTVQQRPLIVHATVEPGATFRTLLRTVAMRRAEGATHGNVTIPDLVRVFAEDTSPGRHPLFQAGFVQRNALGETAALSTDNPYTHPVDLACVWEDSGRSLRIRLEYPAGVIAPDVAARLPVHVANILRAAVSLPEAPVATLPMLTTAEYLEKARG